MPRGEKTGGSAHGRPVGPDDLRFGAHRSVHPIASPQPGFFVCSNAWTLEPNTCSLLRTLGVVAFASCPPARLPGGRGGGVHLSGWHSPWGGPGSCAAALWKGEGGSRSLRRMARGAAARVQNPRRGPALDFTPSERADVRQERFEVDARLGRGAALEAQLDLGRAAQGRVTDDVVHAVQVLVQARVRGLSDEGR